MLNQILVDTLMIFLVTYALVDILSRLLNLFCNHTEHKINNTKLLIYVDSEDNLEKVARASQNKAHQSKSSVILVLNNELSANSQITNKICKEFPYITILYLEDDVINQIFEDTSSKSE